MGQYIDQLSKVIGNAKEVKILMKKVPMFEDENRVLEKENTNIKNMLESLETRMGNIEK